MNQQTFSDLETCGVENPGFWQFLKALWLNPSFLAIYLHRKAYDLFPKSGWKRLLARALWRYAYTHCGCDIKPHVTIGKRCHFPHPLGVVIGSDAVIEDDVTIYQNVTLGQRQKNDDLGFPLIRSGAIIYAGACVLGDITIGRNAIIGANAVVLRDVPDNAIVAGAPGKVIKTRSHHS